MKITWDPQAQAHLRDIAIRILRALDRYTLTGKGDIRHLHPPRTERRPRVGDYRIFFLPQPQDAGIRVTAILHRGQAHR